MSAAQTEKMVFRASAVLVLAAALLAPLHHARADGGLINTNVQVSLKIQQSCQIDSSDATGAAAGSAISAVDASSSDASARPAVASKASGAAASTLAGNSSGQGSDAAPKVLCQFDEPYGVVTTTAVDPTARASNGSAIRPDGATQLASFWTVLF